MTREPAHRRFRAALGVAVLAMGVFAAWLRWNIGGETSVLYVSDAAQILAALVATVTCLHAGARHEDRLRVFWWMLAGACGAWMFGEVIWTAYDVTRSEGPPIPSWADVGFLTFIPLAVGALLCHPGMGGDRARKARSLLDGLAIAVALLFLSWTFVLGPLWRSSDLTTLGGVVTLAYPCGDVVIAFFVVLAVRRMTTAGRLELWCLLAGLIALALADSTYAYVVHVKRYTTGNLLDTGWVAGFLGIGLGALASDVRDLPVRADSFLPALPSLVVPFLPMLVALGVAGISIDLAHPPDRVALTMAFALILLALVRQALLVLDFVVAGRSGRQGNVFDRLASAALGRAISEEAGVEPSRRRPRERSPA